MPGIQFSLTDLERLLGRSLPRDEDGLNEILALVKGDIESVEGNDVSIEVKDSNRPDIWSVEGIARALRSQLDTPEPREVKTSGKSNLRVVIDKRLKSIRPFISTAIVKSLHPSEEALKSWISLQEKLDQTYGRKRKRASIGFYQADLISSPLNYTVANPDRASFAPLGSETKSTLREIVASHPKGMEYGQIISGFSQWPLLVDGQDRVLSLPPVINSNDLGRIDVHTENILVEVTGTNLETVHSALKIVVASLAERGGSVYTCQELYPYGSSRRVTSPDLNPTSAKLNLPYLNSLLGTSLNSREASRAAEKAGYRVQRASGETIYLEIPCYRTDIMHSVDIIEDIAIALHLNKFKPEWPRIWTAGSQAEETDEIDTIGEIMIGLGFQEVLTYVLTSMQVAVDNMQTSSDGLIKLLNPRMSTHTVARNWLLPSLIEFLSRNTHVDYPQKIFEIGATINRGVDTNQPVAERSNLAAVTVHSEAGFTEIRSSLDALMDNAGWTFQIRETTHPSFLPGRCGAILSAGRNIGTIGELSPRVLRAWGLNLPAAAFDLTIPRREPTGVAE